MPTATMITKRIMVTGATEKQGGGVVRALAALNELQPSTSPNPYTILAVTRSASSPKAQTLLKLRGVELLEGNLNDPTSLFANAGGPVYGVFSVQMALDNPDKGIIGEERQGKELADAAKKAGVEHFVYSSVDFGGLEDTKVSFWESKRRIEAHLASTGLPTTILRPVALVDGFKDFNSTQTKVFSTLLTKMTFSDPGKKIQLVACSDIGRVVAKAFENPSHSIGKILPLAGDEVTVAELKSTFREVFGHDLPTTFRLLPWLIKVMVPDLASMLKFCDKNGNHVDISKLRREFGTMKTWEEFCRTELK